MFRTFFFLLFLVWAALSAYWYTCMLKGLCGDNILANSDRGGVFFRWGSDEPVINGRSGDVTDPQLKYLNDNPGHALEITGEYDKDEPNNSGFANLGLARSDALKSLFGGDDRVITAAKEVDFIEGQDFYKAHETQGFQRERSQYELIQRDGVATAYFPTGSAEAQVNQDFIDDLNGLAQQALDSNAKVAVVGHTDNTGSPDVNMVLGLERAIFIREKLVEGGVAERNVSVASQGEKQPIASNASERGRMLNRRVEIVLEPNAAEPEPQAIDNSAADGVGYQLILGEGGKATAYFPFGSANAEIDPSFQRDIANLANSAVQQNAKALVVGHTDNVGDHAANKQLGLKRAEFVRDLLTQSGLTAESITVGSDGDASPIASNDTDEGRNLNRRVEITIQN